MNIFTKRLVPACLLFCGTVGAQAPSTIPAPAVAQNPPPVVDPAREIKGRELLDALRKGGFVLYLRHAETKVVTEQCTESNITTQGEEQARAVGAALRELRIPVSAVHSSALCRARDTAKALSVGDVTIDEALNPVAPRPGYDLHGQRMRLLGIPPAAGGNTVLVSHMHGSRNKDEWLHLGLVEIIVFRPDGKGRGEAVARIPLARWEELKKLP